jgi:hypothetical protein
MARLGNRTIALGGCGCALALGGCGGAQLAGSATLVSGDKVTAAASNPVTVSPLPGTPDASPNTQISFLGGPGTRVTAVRVRGSLSGVHGGMLRAYSTGTGESFLPAQPFVAGERVSVTARTISARGVRHAARTSFTVAAPVSVSEQQFPPAAGDPSAVQHYSSAPALSPSRVTITTPPGNGAAAGDLFLAPYQGRGTPGPMIVDQRGGLVWFHPLAPGFAATNFRVTRYRGAPVLSWWQGRILELGFGQGEDVIYDTSYRQVARIRAGNGYRADLHSLTITPAGTAWIDAFDPVRLSLAAAGGSAAGVLTDAVVQEIDIRTGLVMWEWHALGHIPAGESKNPLPSSSYPWDYVHVNAVTPGPHGDVLMSFRNTWSLDDVDVHSGGIRWRIGGAHSSFKLASAATFYWQHDGAFQPGGQISLFDNGSDPAQESQSRGLLLAPDQRSRTVAVVGRFVNPMRTLLASSQGNMLRLPDGNWLLGYGALPNFTEFAPSGRVLLDGTLGPGVQSFIASLSPWSGHPLDAPALAVTRLPGGSVSVAASWNGATQVRSWRVLAGSSPGQLRPVASAPREGFETTIATSARGPYVAVQALDAAGAVLAVSAATRG